MSTDGDDASERLKKLQKEFESAIWKCQKSKSVCDVVCGGPPPKIPRGGGPRQKIILIGKAGAEMMICPTAKAYNQSVCQEAAELRRQLEELAKSVEKS